MTSENDEIPGLSRRKFLGGAVAGAAAASISGTAFSATRKIPLIRSEERVVVIGSGFGGGISALRLAQAGVPVLVLERGRWWQSGPNAETFPHAAVPDKRLQKNGCTRHRAGAKNYLYADTYSVGRNG